jgi:2-polyprenyl-6-methoxyphenol hydroxylase-like FAD-dependent oxidoreductase
VSTSDVIVVGAGPVGLTLAADLALAGLSVTVLERLTEQAGWIKAGGINGRSTQFLSRRGLADVLKAESERNGAGFAAFSRSGATASSSDGAAAAQAGRRFDGHFGGLFLHAGPGFQLPPSTVLPQQALERLLMDRVIELGVPVLRGHDVTAVSQDEDRVTVRACGTTFFGRYLVGCDGGRSDVRKLVGFAFPGTDPITTGYQAVVTLADPTQPAMGWNLTATGLCAHGPTPGRLLLVSFQGPPAGRSVDISREELEGALRYITGHDVDIAQVHATTRFTDNTRQAATYRQGRVLLAGDAAHVHPPFGGQGLNIGLQDAANLGWKLAATVNGWAPEGLLDTYESERHPVAARVLTNTRAQLSIMRPDAHSRAMRELLADLLSTPGLTERVVAMMQGLDIAYDMGPAATGHPLTGRHMPDLPGLDDAMRTARPVLVDLTASRRLRELADGWADRVALLTTGERSGIDGLTAALVRPDGYVAWAVGHPPQTADITSLRAALHHWFGASHVAPPSRSEPCS